MASLRLLHVGDVVGDPGIAAVTHLLPELRESDSLDFVVVNGENSHKGRGFNERQVKKMLAAGADVITGGDHSFDKHLIFGYMNKEERLLRPFNYPDDVPGKGFGVYHVPAVEAQVAVLNLRGQSFFHNPIRCPLQGADAALGELEPHTNLIFVDYHAEATAEKIAMGWYLDGRVSAVSGTHTHVQTGDEQILPQGTGYLTDVGFTGAHNSVIGLDTATALERMKLQIPRKYKAGKGDTRLKGALYEIDLETGKCLKVKRYNISCPEEAVDDLLKRIEESEEGS